ncbi:type II toxin-antitoxin system VapC family toxin [Luteolibacter pohnpeiensis]|uniref:Type II toxin-antitoxin system VapC family toxin n=1 Tax=Luteolibacter pohnpeiensis TaxID=454153 RepID=A0A934S2H1_9BACT|nr:type II toxin-antitoxin system VapC family toxin [Luteolibacter pohnpeiensis]MBK1881216.1 type II toxin-antitoxin system VapC family toxin [Luteolibacter pohnpeiensis]
MIYCDTSLLLSLYVADGGSDRAGELLDNASEPLVWSVWHELEFIAALEARVGRGSTTRKEADGVSAELAMHRDRDGLYVVRSADWDRVLARATDLAKKWGADFLCRSLDLLHVAVCLELGVGQFWSFDERQRKMAASEGLRINL